MINSTQKWFVLIWLFLASMLGAWGMINNPTDAAAWVFGTPLALLALWGLAKHAS